MLMARLEVVEDIFQQRIITFIRATAVQRKAVPRLRYCCAKTVDIRRLTAALTSRAKR